MPGSKNASKYVQPTMVVQAESEAASGKIRDPLSVAWRRAIGAAAYGAGSLRMV